MIRQEYGTRQTAGNARYNVDQTDTDPTNQLLHVTHNKHLEADRYQQRNQPVDTQQSPVTASVLIITRCLSNDILKFK